MPQLVAPGRIEPRRTLPSFPVSRRRPARRRLRARAGRAGAHRLVHSAKSGSRIPTSTAPPRSCLGFAGNRTRALAGRSLGASFCAKFREAWDEQHKARPLAEQDIVLTVPASFDEEARELTVMAAARGRHAEADAARRARRRLLFLDRQQFRALAQAALRRPDRAGLRRRRRHQRLQPDPRGAAKATASISRAPPSASICCWAATISISRWPGWWRTKLGEPLSIRQRSGLRRQCSAAKERLLCDPHLKSVEITVLGGGSSLIGGSLKTRNPARGGAGTDARRLSAHHASAAMRPRRKSAASSANSACPTSPIPPSPTT